jgi:hypothetical protein
MFKRIVHEDWVSIVPMIAFGFLFVVFLLATVRALRLRPSERERMATLPLDDSPSDH